MSKNDAKMKKPAGWWRLGIIVAAGVILLVGGLGILSFQNGRSHIVEVNDYDPEYEPGRIIDHRDVRFIEEYLKKHPQSVQAVSQTNWFFAHASVGSNMMDGLALLHNDDAALYPLSGKRVRQAFSDPPKTVEPGVIYEIDRGDPAAYDKRRMFDAYMNKGWNTRVTAVLNKYAYSDNTVYDYKLDWDGNIEKAQKEAEEYVLAMEGYQAYNAKLKVVLTTIPLTAEEDRANFLRQAFNEEIREHCRARGWYLLDIADIESHYMDGTINRGYHEESGAHVEQLVTLYTTDGGHLNYDGKRLLAKAWYAMAVTVAEPAVGAGQSAGAKRTASEERVD